MEEYFKSWDDLTVVEQLQTEYSDFFKDVRGFRPRVANSLYWHSEEWLREEINDLRVEYARVQKLEEAHEQECINEVESSIAKLISSGAKDRKTAVRWLLDSMDSYNDPDYATYELGVPFNYFKQDMA